VTKWLDPTVKVLYAFPVTIAAGVYMECDFYWHWHPPLGECFPFHWRTKVRIVAAQGLVVTHSVHGKVTVVGIGVQVTGDVV